MTMGGVVQVANQIEAHPLLLQDDLVEYCKKNNVHLTAYSPLGNNSTLLGGRVGESTNRLSFQWRARRC